MKRFERFCACLTLETGAKNVAILYLCLNVLAVVNNILVMTNDIGTDSTYSYVNQYLFKGLEGLQVRRINEILNQVGLYMYAVYIVCDSLVLAGVYMKRYTLLLPWLIVYMFNLTLLAGWTVAAVVCLMLASQFDIGGVVMVVGPLLFYLSFYFWWTVLSVFRNMKDRTSSDWSVDSVHKEPQPTIKA